MSDIENLDVMLGNVQGNDLSRHENASDADFDLGSRRQEGEANLVGENVRSLLITNVVKIVILLLRLVEQSIQKFLQNFRENLKK